MKYKKIQELIETRRSVYPKQFSGEKIKRKTIEKWLELANWAPNHKLTEPWRFVVFGKDAVKNLVDLHKADYIKNTSGENLNEKKLENFDMVKANTSHMVAIVCKLDDAKRLPEWEEIAATAMAVQNLYIGMQSLDIVGYWSTGNGTNAAHTRAFLELSENEIHLGWFYLGILANDVPLPNRVRKPMAEKVKWIEA